MAPEEYQSIVNLAQTRYAGNVSLALRAMLRAGLRQHETTDERYQCA